MEKNKYSKIPLLLRKPGNNSGIMIIVVLWVLVILTALAVSLGRKTNIELSLAKHAISDVKAKYLAWAGLIYAIEQIREDTQEDESSEIDTLYYCAIPFKEDSNEYSFTQQQDLGSGYFDFEYHQADLDESNSYYGLQDEERKININGLTGQNLRILTGLLELLDVEEETANIIASSVVDWKDADLAVLSDDNGAEDDYYMSLNPSYHCKNAFFDSTEELLLVRGMNEEIYEKLRPYITVFPKDNILRFNFDTASETILKSVARSLAGLQSNTDISDADSLVGKMLDYRKGDDGQEFTADDQQIEISDLVLNAKERVISLLMNQYRTKQSEYVYVEVAGTEATRGVQSHIEAVVSRDDLSILSWRRN